VLGLDGFGAAALTDLFVLILDLSEEFDDALRIFLKVWGVAMDRGFQSLSGHAGSLRMTSMSRQETRIGYSGRAL